MSVRAAGPAKPPTYCVPGAVSPLVKRLRHDVDHSSGVEFKNHWSHICTYGVHGDSLPFCLYIFCSYEIVCAGVRALVFVCSLIGNADLAGNPTTSQASVFHFCFFFLHLPKLLQ